MAKGRTVLDPGPRKPSRDRPMVPPTIAVVASTTFHRVPTWPRKWLQRRYKAHAAVHGAKSTPASITTFKSKPQEGTHSTWSKHNNTSQLRHLRIKAQQWRSLFATVPRPDNVLSRFYVGGNKSWKHTFEDAVKSHTSSAHGAKTTPASIVLK